MVAALSAYAAVLGWSGSLSVEVCGDDLALGRGPAIAPFAACIEFESCAESSDRSVAEAGVLVVLNARLAAVDTQVEGGEAGCFGWRCARPAARKAS